MLTCSKGKVYEKAMAIDQCIAGSNGSKLSVMSKLAIVTSFHSYSLRLTALKPSAIVSFDSHLDDYFGGGEKTFKAVSELSFPYSAAFWRTSVHNLLKRTEELHQTPVYVVIPEGCFENRAFRDAAVLAEKGIDMGNYIEARIRFVEKFVGLKLFFCPPRDIASLFKKVDRHSTAIDVES